MTEDTSIHQDQPTYECKFTVERNFNSVRLEMFVMEEGKQNQIFVQTTPDYARAIATIIERGNTAQFAAAGFAVKFTPHAPGSTYNLLTLASMGTHLEGRCDHGAQTNNLISELRSVADQIDSK